MLHSYEKLLQKSDKLRALPEALPSQKPVSQSLKDTLCGNVIRIHITRGYMFQPI